MLKPGLNMEYILIVNDVWHFSIIGILKRTTDHCEHLCKESFKRAVAGRGGEIFKRAVAERGEEIFKRAVVGRGGELFKRVVLGRGGEIFKRVVVGRGG